MLSQHSYNFAQNCSIRYQASGPMSTDTGLSSCEVHSTHETTECVKDRASPICVPCRTAELADSTFEAVQYIWMGWCVTSLLPCSAIQRSQQYISGSAPLHRTLTVLSFRIQHHCLHQNCTLYNFSTCALLSVRWSHGFRSIGGTRIIVKCDRQRPLREPLP